MALRVSIEMRALQDVKLCYLDVRSNRGEVDSDNLYALLLLLCTRTVLVLVRQRVGSLIFLSMIVLKFGGRGRG
jgi:hypothetical protein